MNFSRVSYTSILGILLILLSGLSNAGQLDDAFTAHDKGDYVQAFKLLQPMATQGDAQAQGFLGSIYGLGQGVPQDYKQAFDWSRKAAVQGYSLITLGLCITEVKAYHRTINKRLIGSERPLHKGIH